MTNRVKISFCRIRRYTLICKMIWYFPFYSVRRYTRQLLEAVACLHEHGVVHRDIKVNLLLDCYHLLNFCLFREQIYSWLRSWKLWSLATLVAPLRSRLTPLCLESCRWCLNWVAADVDAFLTPMLIVKFKAHTTMPGELQVILLMLRLIVMLMLMLMLVCFLA